MFFNPIKSGITRCNIWPSVSSVLSSSPRPWSSATAFGKLYPLTQFESVVIGNHDFGAADFVQHVAGNEFAIFVVTIRIVGLKNAQPIFDREPWSNHKKAARETFTLRMPHSVDGMPGDEHRHHRGLTSTGGELKRKPHQIRICIVILRCNRTLFFYHRLADRWTTGDSIYFSIAVF